MVNKLRIGFDLDVPEDQACVEALTEWGEACTREGRAITAATARVIRDDPERTALGEYLVEVTGDGDQ